MKIITTCIVLAVVTITIAACSSGTVNHALPRDTPKPTIAQPDLSALALSLTTEAACKARYGSWERVGIQQEYACVLSANDAGKTCTDTRDCQVSCLAVGEVTAGAKAAGECSASTNLFGCHARIINGRAEPALCMD